MKKWMNRIGLALMAASAAAMIAADAFAGLGFVVAVFSAVAMIAMPGLVWLMAAVTLAVAAALALAAGMQATTESRLGALMVITAAQSISIWNIGVRTAAAQNLVAVGFIQESMGATISWPQWFAAGAPWAAVMSVVLYFVMRATIRPEIDRLEGGREIAQKSPTELGPMTGAEKRLAAVAVILLAFWSTQGSLHDIDATTVTLCAIGVMLLPRIGVYSWKTVEELVSWVRSWSSRSASRRRLHRSSSRGRRQSPLRESAEPSWAR